MAQIGLSSGARRADENGVVCRSLRGLVIVSAATSVLAGAGLVHATSTGGVDRTTDAVAVAVAPQAATTYVVRAGDSLWGISRRFGVSLNALLTANGLTVTSVIHPGQRLTIPSGTGATAPPATRVPVTTAPSAGASSYTVRAGDSLYGIARRLGVSLPSLLTANGLSLSSVIHPGQRLTVPSATTPTTRPPTVTTRPPTVTTRPPATTRPPTPTTRPPTVTTRPASGTYTIVAGDSLYGISRRLGVSFSALLTANGLTANSLIHPGQTLVIPTGSGPTPTTSPAVPNTITTAEAERIIRQVWPDDLEQMAVDIARRESGLRPNAQNGCCVGLFQIYYDLHAWWLTGVGITSRGALFDARTNAQAALALYQRAGWTPWAVPVGT